MDEFDGIERLFRPLATSPEALGLRDDAALLPARPGFELVVTTDAIVEGVHFLTSDPPELVARKLLRVNLSDLAAKAAEPYGYLLTVAWPGAWDQARRSAFASGLGEDQSRYGLKLFGGDTVSTSGPMMASATMFGWVESGWMVRRSTARSGDILLVSGTIGDGSLGLKAARSEWSGEGSDWLARRYRLPEPRLALRDALCNHVNAAADVSDGLLADAGHIAKASGLAVRVDLDALPISEAARSAVPTLSTEVRLALASGGDDYELVCTAAPEQVQALVAASERAGVPLTPVGQMIEGEGVYAALNGLPVEIANLGWRHG